MMPNTFAGNSTGCVVWATLAVCCAFHSACFSQQASLADEQPELLRRWTARFQADREQWLRDETARQDLVSRLTIQDGLVFLNDVDSARPFQQLDPARRPDERLLQTISAQARIGRVAQALALMDGFQQPGLQAMALRMLANTRLHADDVETALKLVERAEPKWRGRLQSDVVYKLLELRDIDQARRIMGQIQDEQILKVLKPVVERESRRPRVTEPDFVQRHVDWGWQGIWQQWQDGAELRALRGQTLPGPDKARSVAMLTHVSRALLAQHEQQAARGLAELTKARDLARQYPTEEEQVRELLSVAALAHRMGHNDLARAILLDTANNPIADDYYLLLTWHSLPPIDAIAALLTAEEIRPLLVRWQQDELPMELIEYVKALGRQRKFPRLDGVHGEMQSVAARVIVDVTVLELLLDRTEDVGDGK